MLLEGLMKIEIGKLYSRIELLEHLGRQMLGTVELLKKNGEFRFDETMEEILEKWRNELGPKKSGRKRVA